MTNAKNKGKLMREKKIYKYFLFLEIQRLIDNELLVIDIYIFRER